MNRGKKVALYGVIVTTALALGYLESLLPPFFVIPGMKLGLTNVVVLVVLYRMGGKSALAVNGLRILLVSFLFGSGMSFWYSLAGGLLSGLSMILLKRTGKFHIVTVSVAGGVLHNVGQILVAMAVLRTAAVGWYLLVLWFAGLFAGALVGVLGAFLCARLSPKIFDK